MKLTMDEGLVINEAIKLIYYTNYKESKEAPADKPVQLIERENLPFSFKYRLTKNKDVLSAETAMFQPERDNLIRKYGTDVKKIDPETKEEKVIAVQVGLDHMQEYTKALEDMLSTEIDCNLHQLNDKDIEYLDTVKDLDLNEFHIRVLEKYIFKN